MTAFVKITLLGAASAIVLSACTMSPRYERGALPVPSQFPTAVTATGASADTLPWRQVFLDPRLQGVIDQALTNNRDLRVAILNVDKARSQYRIQRASLFPAVNATVAGSRGNTGTVDTNGNPVGTTEAYSASVGASWEVDLFGRVRSLNQAALQSYFAVAENRKAAQISLISAVASAWLNLAADQEQLRLSQQTLRLREESLNLTQKRFDVGATDQMILRQTQVLTEQARADVASLTATVQQDRNALRLLVGAEVTPDLLPDAFPDNAVLANLPVGVPSDILLKRPDVMAAEYSLKSANANIGAARAAFFPSISLTASAGKASSDLGKLFDGIDTWTFAPSISVPIFAGGANAANLSASKTSRDIAVAQYEGAIQSAFRDVADQLATRATIDDRLTAQTRVVEAATDSNTLAQARFDRGVDSRLTLTDSERTLYSAQQQLISIRLVRTLNLINLYAALGGGLN
ncbi:efflux transporter outer membrane subunit [Asticcacaulis sp. 201]|uniref:efflux transporter outer membrane subunit n=1 Tax=Asticcacaulis sp. 201 TaxID=3028787 RepID=UPI002916A6B6|nr:efflux transporter outer membrane subunit [Asticcacaulis sp. 201]MDV6332314.1 efflux transporter outer membrane subunit [Asticcacaulis sp. 201]